MNHKAFAKVGTFPKCVIECKTNPDNWTKGDKVTIRSDHDDRIHKWTECRVCKIDRWCGESIYFLEL